MKIAAKRNLALAAVGGMLTGLAGCSGSALPVEVPGAPNEDPVVASASSIAPAAQPVGVEQPAAKHACNASMNMKPTAPAPAPR